MLRDFIFGLNGVLMLLRLDARGILFFPPTGPGAMRSFMVAPLLFPAYALVTYLDWLKGGEPAAWHYFSLQLLSYAISWMAYPLIVYEISRIMGVAILFPRYLAAYNYSAIPITLFLLPIEIVGYILPGSEIAAMGLMAVIMAMSFQWFICRLGLMLKPLTAMGLVLIDATLSVIIHSLVDRLVQA